MTEHDKWIAKVVDHLNRLIQLDFDASLTYKDALVHVDDPIVRVDLEAFLVDHERHVMELSSIVRDLGGSPIRVHRDIKGALLEGVTKLRSRSFSSSIERSVASSCPSSLNTGMRTAIVRESGEARSDIGAPAGQSGL